jgi:hypothetical protein
MKMRSTLLMVSLIFLAAGLWAGRAAWRAYRQLVTLDVRNAPLADVLRKVEWQTWKRIRAENAIEARITLHVHNKPLSEVLDRIAEQAGARWTTLYAVYGSTRALKALDATLRSDGKLEPAGWTKIAPATPAFDPPPGPKTGGTFPVGPGADGPDGSGPGGLGPNGPGPGPRMGGTMVFRRAGGGPTFIQSANGQTEVWSREELIMETPLSSQFGAVQREAVTAQAATEVAREVHGRWTTYLAFRKSSLGFAFDRMPHGPPDGPRGPGQPGLFPPPHHDPNDRFARLTPAQRVQRARERLPVGE